MARHPQPLELVRLKGADKHDPQRYAGTEPKSTLPLGDAPALTPHAALCWDELSACAVPGVLTGSDRQILEIAANLLAEYRRSPEDFAIGKYTHLIGSLARLGMSPSDRAKLRVAEDPDDGGFRPM